MKKIDDVAVDRSRYYTRSYRRQRIRWFFDRLFPRLYLWRLDRVIRKYEEMEKERRRKEIGEV